jgi:hypothetical protein
MPPAAIYSVSGGKITGNIWPVIQKDYVIGQHTGDNQRADFETPRAHGIRADLYVESHCETENRLIGMGFRRIADLSRVLRLSNPYTDIINRDIWNEQATINVPVLILASLYIPMVYNGKRVLMMTRDCNNLLKIFPLVIKEMQAEELYSSRRCLRVGSAGYQKYFREKLGFDNPLLVDLHGTGQTKDMFYEKFGYHPQEFYMIQSTTKDVPYRKYIVHRDIWDAPAVKQGYLWEIENTNLDVVGSVVDVKGDKPIRAPMRYNPAPVMVQQLAVAEACRLLSEGFEIRNKVYNMEYIREAVTYLLRTLHSKGMAIVRAGVPDINDWPI